MYFNVSAVDCGAPPSVRASTSTPETVTITTYLATVQFDCNTGYEFSDTTVQKTMECQPDKTWNDIGDCQGG